MNKEEITSLFKEYEPNGSTDIEKLTNLISIWRGEGHITVNEAHRETELDNILEAILSSLPTHKEETKTELQILKEIKFSFEIQSDMSAKCNGYNYLCHKIAELEKGLSVPQPLKPLSDEEKKKIIFEKIDEGDLVEKRIIEKLGNYTDRDDVVVGTICNILYDNFSLPVDNTVSEETIDSLLCKNYKSQINNLRKIGEIKDLEIASLKEVVSEKSTFFHNQYKGILNEWEKCVSDRDMNIELLVKDVKRLTSQLSLYNKADNILKDIVMSKSNEVGEDLTKRIVKILEDLQTLKQE